MLNRREGTTIGGVDPAMTTFSLTARQYRLAFVLFVLIFLVVFRLWSHRPREVKYGPSVPAAIRGNGPFSDGPPGPDSAPWQRMQEAIQKLPVEQRKQIEERMQQDQEFFATLQALPPEQRRQKMEEHLAQNPPPFLPPPPTDGGPPPMPGPGGGGGPGGPENGPMHLPSPSVRHDLDRQIANSQRKAGGQ